MSDIPTITVRLNGPYRVQGRLELRDADGNAFTLPGESFSLCRCGASGKKPFCDGTHSRIGFDAPTRAAPVAAQPEGDGR